MSSPGRHQSGDKLASTIPRSAGSHNSGEPGPGESQPLAAEPKAAGLPTAETVTSEEGMARRLHHLKVRTAAPQGQDGSQDRHGGKALKGTASVARGRPLLDARPRAPGPRGLQSEHLPTVFSHCPRGAPAAGEHEDQQSRPGVNPRGAGDAGESLPPRRQRPVVPQSLERGSGRMPRSPPQTP